MTGLTTGIASGAKVIDAATFDGRLRRAASAFAALGVGRDDCVAVMMRNDTPFLEASLGAQRLGAYAVPVNWHFKGEEVSYILNDCGAKVLVIHSDLLRGVAGAVPAGVTVIVVPTSQEIAAACRVPAELLPPPEGALLWDDLLARHAPQEGPPAPPADSMIYTSGTTGNPKGVRRRPASDEDRAKVEKMRDMVYGLQPGMRTAIAAPMYHSAPNAFSLRAVRLAELFVCLPKFDPEGLLALIDREKLTHLWLVPTMFVRMLKLPEEVRAKYDVSSLKFIIHAGAPCPPDVKEAVIGWFGPIVHEYYGGTESGPVVFCDSHEWLAHKGTVGKPIEGAVVQVQDENGKPLPPYERGEIFMRISFYPDFTYHNLPEKRAEIDRNGLITCGDVGYFDEDGYLYICDRVRDMVISGGVNIYPAEIESALAALPGVRDCVVFGVPDPEMGEALLALVQPLEGRQLDPEALRAELRRRIADYKVPKVIEIREDLPREDSGKIFKRKLREPYWQGAGRAV
ncbi:acyl-CoA synthetase [Camelimonas abortus]|uniref:Acyl-CoA synthetase n=1 Tax=Camelimonas abortus TaxID=1017184 RepID=A0ABV7LBT9_9HYPH